MCVGWIDGVRKRIDTERYQIRSSTRRPASTWSAVNINRVAAWVLEGRMQPAGLVLFAQRQEARSRTASYEQASLPTLASAQAAHFQQQPAAWAFFTAQSATYQRQVVWWVVSAKQAQTQAKRLHRLMDASAAGLRL